MSTSSSKSKQTQSSTQALDPAIKAGLLSNVTQAQTAAGSLTPFTGQRVADVNANQTAGQAGLLSVANSNVGGGLLNTAGAAASSAAAYKPFNITSNTYTPATVAPAAAAPYSAANAATAGPATQAAAGSVDRSAIQNVSTGAINPDQINAYLNPYTSQVVDTTNADLDRQRQIEQLNNATQATNAHAFGGTGAAILSGLTNDNYARQTATTDAALRQSGYNTALSAAQADAQRRLSADTSNQGADLTAATTNAGLLNSTNQFNAGAINTRTAANTDNTQQANLANASAANQNSEFNANLLNTNALANQQALNSGAQFNAGQDFNAQQANQNAGLNANSQSITASGLLGNLSSEKLAQATSNAGLIGQVGDTQQAQAQKVLDAAHQAYQDGQTLTQTQLDMVNKALALLGNPALTQSQGQSTSKSSSFDISQIAAAAILA